MKPGKIVKNDVILTVKFSLVEDNDANNEGIIETLKSDIKDHLRTLKNVGEVKSFSVGSKRNQSYRV